MIIFLELPYRHLNNYLSTTKVAKEAALYYNAVSFQSIKLERRTFFAGREAEMAQIDTFLQTRERGHIFVTGPSGRIHASSVTVSFNLTQVVLCCQKP